MLVNKPVLLNSFRVGALLTVNIPRRNLYGDERHMGSCHHLQDTSDREHFVPMFPKGVSWLYKGEDSLIGV